MYTSKPAGGENPPTKEPTTGKTQVQQESTCKQEKWQLQTIQKRRSKRPPAESHRTPTTEVYSKKTADKVDNWESQKKKESPKRGRQRNNPQSK